MVEMVVHSIRAVNYQRVVVLKEKAADRCLPIWIGPAEADAIAIRLQDVRVPRPLTHDLLQSVISNLGARVNFIVVSDLRNDTFYARIMLSVEGRSVEVDSRPSDAIALAVRVEVPIYVEEPVLDKAGLFLDPDTGKVIPQPADDVGDKGGKVDDEELRKMSAFRDFLDSLNLEDLDKDKP